MRLLIREADTASVELPERVSYSGVRMVGWMSGNDEMCIRDRAYCNEQNQNLAKCLDYVNGKEEVTSLSLHTYYCVCN